MNGLFCSIFHGEEEPYRENIRIPCEGATRDSAFKGSSDEPPSVDALRRQQAQALLELETWSLGVDYDREPHELFLPSPLIKTNKCLLF